MSLDEKQKRSLRSRGHGLRPVVSIGSAGLSKSVLRELELSLAHHELMKIRIASVDRSTRQRMIGEICSTLQAELVQAIGHTALLYRASPD